jgi:hypothetical protein
MAHTLTITGTPPDYTCDPQDPEVKLNGNLTVHAPQNGCVICLTVTENGQQTAVQYNVPSGGQPYDIPFPSGTFPLDTSIPYTVLAPNSTCPEPRPKPTATVGGTILIGSSMH